MELSFAHSNAAAVGGAWPVMDHQQVHGDGEPSGRIAGCSHFPRQHYGGSSAPRRAVTHTSEVAPKWVSGSTWFGWLGIHRKCWSELLSGRWKHQQIARPASGVSKGGGWGCLPPPTGGRGRGWRPDGGGEAGGGGGFGSKPVSGCLTAAVPYFPPASNCNPPGQAANRRRKDQLDAGQSL
jgi:hypothetical protein